MSRVQTHRAQTSSGKENRPPASKNVSQELDIVLNFLRMTQQMRQSQKTVADLSNVLKSGRRLSIATTDVV
jgi:hypothetical protein